MRKDPISSSIGSIGTEIFHNKHNRKSGGGAKDCDCAKLAIDAFQKSQFEVVRFLVFEDYISNYAVANAEGYTLLHFLAAHSKLVADAKCMLDKILERSDVASFINAQDKKGNTPLHYAVLAQNNEVAGQLIARGANKDVKNKKDERVVTDKSDADAVGDFLSLNAESSFKEQPESAAPEISVFIPRGENRPSAAPSADVMSDRLLRQFFSGIGTSSKRAPESSALSPGLPSHLGATDTARSDTSNFVAELIDKYGKYGNEQDFPQMQQRPYMAGGATSITGKRRMRTISEFATKLSSESGSISSSDGSPHVKRHKHVKRVKLSKHRKSSRHHRYSPSSDKSQSSASVTLDRLIKNQASEIHEQTIEIIKKLLDISEDEARLYKAALYKIVREKHPELNNFDRASEMKKLANEDVLKSSEVRDLVKYIKKDMSEKENQPGKELRKPKKSEPVESDSSNKKQRKSRKASSSDE